MKRCSLIFAVLAITGLLTSNQAAAVEIPVVEWTRLLGTKEVDNGFGVSVDGSGNAYVTGRTLGGLDGNTNAGSYDMFLTKYDADGVKLWTRQLGTPYYEDGRSVSVDGGGNAYVTGYTRGGLDGNTNAGSTDAFLIKYDTDGNKQWTRQLGNSGIDVGSGVSVDGSGNAYVTGYTFSDLDGNTNAGEKDMFLTKYDVDGVKLWTQQLGSSHWDEGNGVSVDGSGNAYVTGYTEYNIDGNTSAGYEDIFLTKYDTDGTKQWTHQLGTTGRDYAFGVSVDAGGNAYVTGRTDGSFDGHTNAGYYDMFLAKYDTDGAKLWTQQLGTSGLDWGLGVSVDGKGDVYVAGQTEGDLDGNTNAGRDDIFLTKYDSDGTRLWTELVGTSKKDYGLDVSVDGSGNAYITGYTSGSLGGNTNADSSAIFLVKISTIPEPSTIVLLCMGAFGLLARGWRRR